MTDNDQTQPDKMNGKDKAEETQEAPEIQEVKVNNPNILVISDVEKSQDSAFLVQPFLHKPC